MEAYPLLFGHQLLGDSHLVKLAKMLGYQPDKNAQDRIGLCITGQSILDLTLRLQDIPVLYDRVILMIGNRDLQMADIHTMRMHFMNLIDQLLPRVRKLVVLSVLPSPEFISKQEYKLRSLSFNRWLLNVNWWQIMRDIPLHEMAVVDVSSPFLYYNDGIREEYFECLEGNSGDRPDGVHLNDEGLDLLLEVLERKSEPIYLG